MADLFGCPFTDVEDDAAWRPTVFTHKMFLALAAETDGVLSHIFRIAGLRIEYITSDLMHTADLGTVQYLLGCIIWEVLFIDMSGTESDPQDVLSQFGVFIRIATKQIASETKRKEPPINRLTIGMIRKQGSPPKLKTKAVEGRRMVPVVLWILENLIPRDTRHQKLRINCILQMKLMYDALEAPVFDPVKVASHGRKHLKLWIELGRSSLELSVARGKLWILYRWYPKHHLLLHTLEDQVLIAGNPRECWAYEDESTIGEAVKIAESLHASSLHKSVIAKKRC